MCWHTKDFTPIQTLNFVPLSEGAGLRVEPFECYSAHSSDRLATVSAQWLCSSRNVTAAWYRVEIGRWPKAKYYLRSETEFAGALQIPIFFENRQSDVKSFSLRSGLSNDMQFS